VTMIHDAAYDEIARVLEAEARRMEREQAEDDDPVAAEA